MRRIRFQRFQAIDVQETLDDFSERAEVEFGIQESDVISVSIMPPMEGVRVHDPSGSKVATCSVVFMYWSEK